MDYLIGAVIGVSAFGYQKQYEAERDALKAAIEKREAELAAARATIGQP